MIEIKTTGSGISLQDAGRAGWRRFGVPAGGAMDPKAMKLANSLLGNHAEACVLEVTLLGGRIRILNDTWFALAGADSCSRLATGTAERLRAGEILNFDQQRSGLYAYLAVPGGFHSGNWMGSASADPRNGIGHALKQGDQIVPQWMEPRISTERVARRVTCEPLQHIAEGTAQFELYRGPQYDAFEQNALQRFIQTTWTVSPRSDRTGYRLEGLEGGALAVPGSRPSGPVLPGSFQVPGNGQPIVTMNDGPTVGGYPQIALLKEEDTGRFAQCTPGTELRFAWIE